MTISPEPMTQPRKTTREATMNQTIEPYQIQVSDDQVRDLRERLARTRYPNQLTGAGWNHGTERDYLRQLCEHWRTEYDWQQQAAQLVGLPHFATAIDGQRVHFIHRRSPEPDALPLILLHGWPGSVYEFAHIASRLADPIADGAAAGDAFHVICPSLPGFGFSGPTDEQGWDVLHVARAMVELMARLGYTRYGIQGGDLGAIVATHMSLLDAERVAGLHLNTVLAPLPEPGQSLEGLTPELRAEAMAAQAFMVREMGYAAIKSTKPQTLGYALEDSPAGLAAWIVEKFRAWSDCNGDVETRFTRDQLLTNISIYWFTHTATSASRLYYESALTGRFGPADEAVTVPTGCALFPREPFRPPRAMASQLYNITRWTEMPSGGHFAALEEPDLLVDDIRSFFRTLR